MMNKLLQLFMLMLFLSSCSSEYTRISGNYIQKYAVVNLGTSKTDTVYSNNALYSFKGADLEIKTFPTSLNAHKIVNEFKSWKLLDDTLYMQENGKIDTFISASYGETLSLINVNTPAYKIVLQKMHTYQQSNQLENFRAYLSSATFLRENEHEVEFVKNGHIIYNDLTRYAEEDAIWTVESFHDELFLVIDGFSGAIVQIKEITEDGFTGVGFSEEIYFKELPVIIKHDLSNLIGTWINTTTPPPLALPKLEGDLNFYEREELHISKENLMMLFGHSEIDHEWKSNKSADILLLNGKYLKRKWRIISLSRDELIIERPISLLLFYDEFVHVRFERKQ